MKKELETIVSAMVGKYLKEEEERKRNIERYSFDLKRTDKMSENKIYKDIIETQIKVMEQFLIAFDSETSKSYDISSAQRTYRVGYSGAYRAIIDELKELVK